ncbi:hypothetical protein BMR08_08090, partial [Methylococcaceae bacterium CS2]
VTDIFPLKSILRDKPDDEAMEAFSSEQTRILMECTECTAPIAENTDPLRNKHETTSAVSPGRDDSLQKAQGNLPIRSAR